MKKVTIDAVRTANLVGNQSLMFTIPVESCKKLDLQKKDKIRVVGTIEKL